MGPEALQTRQHVTILRQFDLSLGVGGLCAHGKDIEDEARAVQYLHLELVLDVAHLLGRQLVVEDDHTDFPVVVFFVFYILLDFFQFTLAHVGHRIGAVHFLGKPLYGHRSSRIGQKLQFV